MLNLILVMSVSVFFAHRSERTAGPSLNSRPIRWDIFLVLLTVIMTLFSGLRISYNDSPLSSKRQKNICVTRHLATGAVF